MNPNWQGHWCTNN